MVELSGAHPRRCRLLLFFSLLIATSVSGVRGQGKILNLSGRGINVIYGGFITQGSEPMTVVLRALGPSLRAQGIPRASDDPVLQLYDGNGTPIQKNDDWRSGPDAQAIADVGLAPTNELESALLATVSPGMYTLLVFPYNNTYDAFGASVVEMYDLQMSASRFGNISTRGFLTSSNETVYQVIGGFIIGGEANKPTVVRVVGFPETRPPDTTLQLYDSEGTLIASNDDWQTDEHAAQLQSTGLAPRRPEAALYRSLPPGAYTAVGNADEAGGANGLVEIYDVSASPR